MTCGGESLTGPRPGASMARCEANSACKCEHNARAHAKAARCLTNRDSGAHGEQRARGSSVVHAGEALGERWRHHSVLWAQGLLERYGHIRIGADVAWKGHHGGYFWETADGIGKAKTARDAAEAIIQAADEGDS